MTPKFFLYLAVMAGVTYLIRLLPMLICKKEITNRFFLSFLHYIPYTVLAVMTVPAVFTATGNPLTSLIGFAVALILAYTGRSMATVAFGSCLCVLIAEGILWLI